MSVSGSSVIQQDEMELTKAYTHMTWEDAEHTRTNEKGLPTTPRLMRLWFT